MNLTEIDELSLLSPQVLVNGMDENARALFEQASRLQGGLALLRFLNENANALLTVEDLAFQVKQPAVQVGRNIRKLVEWGWARELELPDCAWFGLTRDAGKRKVIVELFRWQNRWLAKLERLKLALDGAAA